MSDFQCFRSWLTEAPPPEVAREIGDHLEAWICERRDAGDDVDRWQWRRALIDEATRQMAAVREVSTEGWKLAKRERHFEAGLGAWPDELWRDPHTLGWLHEQYAARARAESFAEHVHREAKHSSMTTTTQLYTPRWVADVLARGAIDVVGGEQSGEKIEVLDPAVGGGQMLLAALSVFAEKNPKGLATDWAKRLWGFDLDENAVEVARRTVALEIARRKGARDRAAEAILQRQITCADALDESIDRSWAVVLTNPPYMGWRSMPKELRRRLDPRFRPFHSDLSAAFIARCHQLSHGAVGILAQQSIWYLRRFQKARAELFDRGGIRYFLHLGSGAFWNLDGEKASVAAFVQRSDGPSGDEDAAEAPTWVWDLRHLCGPDDKARAFRESLEASKHEATPSAFDLATTKSVPGRPFCHDLPGELRRLFAERPPLSEWAEVPGSQNKTGRNREFVRSWSEVEPEELRRVDALGGRGSADGRWVFYSKGGRFAPWWGNWQWVVDWSEEGRRFYSENRTSNLLAEEYWFREGIVYTDFGGKRFNARWMPEGCLFDMTGPAIFPHPELWPTLSRRQRIGAVLAVLNSSAARRMLRALNPSLHFQVRDVRALPTPRMNPEVAASIAEHVWMIIEGIRELYGQIEDDPLHGQSAAMSRDERQQKLEALRDLEARVDLQVCQAYGVEQRPIMKASVVNHHAL